MAKKRSLLFIYMLMWGMQLQGFGSWGSIGNEWKSTGEGIYHGIKAIGSAFAQMVGHVSPAYVYSAVVYNGVQSTVHVQARHYDKVMGGRFKGTISNSGNVAPGSNSGTMFHGLHLYFDLEIPSCNYSENHFTLGEKNDSTVYAYHTFNDPYSLKPSGERLGVETGGNTDFSGLIYNGAGDNALIEFVWNKKPIKVPVEADTFNALASTSKNPLRPSVLGLNGQNISIGETGLGSSTTSGSGTAAKTTSTPTRYNYQITSSGGIETGLFPGNFREPGVNFTSGHSVKVPAKLRDITPIECQIWNQFTATQEGTAWKMMPFSLPTQPLWFMYTGQAVNSDGAVIVNPVGHIPEGKCIVLTLLRPPVSQQTAKLYIARINTTDEAAATDFLNELAHTTLPAYNIQPPSKKFIELSEKTILTEKLPEDVGYLHSANGLKGVIVGMDIFASYGAASIGPFYYTVPAPEYSISSVQAVFTQCIDNMTATASKELNLYVQKWVKAYPTDPEGVRRALEIFLIKNGSKTMIAKNGDEESLTPTGYSILNTVLHGPTSVSRMPVWYAIAQKSVITMPAAWASSDDTIIV